MQVPVCVCQGAAPPPAAANVDSGYVPRRTTTDAAPVAPSAGLRQ